MRSLLLFFPTHQGTIPSVSSLGVLDKRNVVVVPSNKVYQLHDDRVNL